MKSFGVLRRNAGCLQWLTKVILLLVFLFLFRYEIRLIWGLILAAPKFFLDQPVTNLPPADELLLQIMFIAFNVAGALLFALLIVYLIGGAVLPVRTAAEQWAAMQLFTRFLRGRRAPLLRVREAAGKGSVWKTESRKWCCYCRSQQCHCPRTADIRSTQSLGLYQGNPAKQRAADSPCGAGGHAGINHYP
jgi:signal transduction histidine kinase